MMKKIYTLLMIAYCFGFMQNSNAQLPSKNKKDCGPQYEEIAHVLLPQNLGNKATNDQTQKASGDTIWYEDFGGGFPSSWTIQDSSGICPWSYTLDGTWGYYNSNNGTGPGDDTLQSATKSNGFLICDPDSANNAVYGQPSGTTYQYLSSYFTTSAIDLSGYPAVLLQFEHLYRFNNGIDLIVGVSADSTNWTNYTVQGNTPNNTQSANAESVKLNISAVAGNQSTVYIRIGWSARVYYWMIDDIRIVEAPGNDLTVTMGKHYPFYKMTPVRQTTGIKFTGAIANNGGNTQTNVQLNTTVTLLVDTTFNDSSAPMSSAPSAIDTVTILDSSYAPVLLGDYMVEYYVTYDSTDFDPSNDSLVNNFAVTDSVYARDEDTYTGWGVSTSTGGTKQRGILYDIWTQDTLSSISVLITGSTPPTGEIVKFHLYDSTLLLPIASSAFYTIQPGDPGNWVTLSIPEFVMTPGQYIATIESFTDSVYVHFDPDAPLPLPQTAFYFSNDGNWYYSTSYTYFVRMNTKRPLCNTNITVTIASNSPSACGDADGDAMVTIVTGTPGYFYSWDDPLAQNTATATGLAAGVYNVTITDNTLCTTTASIIVVDPGAATLVTSTTDVMCMGGMDGTAMVTAFGGVAPLTYSWNTSPAQTGATATGLAAGSYTLSVIDASGCSSFATDTVTEPSTGVAIDSIAVTDVTCNGDGDGSLTATGSGGTGTITYAWTGGPATATYSGVGGGTYTVVVTDANGCTATDSGLVTEPAALAITSSVTDIPCFGDNNGVIDLTVTGGTGTYGFLWNPGGATTEDLSGQGPGAYSVTVTDSNNCTANTAVTINEPAALVAVVDTFTNETVTGANDGTINASATGGTGAYTAFWTGPGGFTSTSMVLTGLAPGTYQLTLNDANGCSATLTQIIAPATVGIEEVINNVVFKVYPNPNTGQFIVELNNLKNDDYQIEIRNIIGQLIHTENVTELSGNFYKQIALTSKETGVYFISISNEEEKITQKLVVY